MSPTVLRMRGLRFYFFSREEPRPHVHVQGQRGEAKLWLEPNVELASNHGLNVRDVNAALKIIEEHGNEIRAAWQEHSAVEVTNVSTHGFWILVGNQESFLPFDLFPWFREATIGELVNVELPSPHHLYWPDLDVDLAMDSITHPEKFPLVSRVQVRRGGLKTPRPNRHKSTKR